jgi:hypothetical protein
MNDQTAAQLISQSLFEPLTDAEKLTLEQHLATSPQSQQYAELSALIQNSLVDESEYNDTSDAAQAEPGLSQLARARIAKRIEIELLRLGTELDDSRLSSSQRRVAEDSEEYTQSNNVDNEDVDNEDSNKDESPGTT